MQGLGDNAMIGKRFAHYEIEGALGAGGMGEVYQARDTRLGRSVAVKVLPERFARDEERVARFQREAKVLASLNHPNIAALYGLEEFEGRHFLIMELVDGETLTERLAKGAIPIEEALRYALQIAEALEAAHEKSIVHRDLKPANIKITPAGKLKVLDFGLAKAMEGAPVDAALSNSPTLSLAATQSGMILGTAAYMSPEQANGFSADARSDVFSFGCVLYEMLARRQAFQGRTLSETLASVLAREPDFKLLPAALHPTVRHVLLRCLEKNPQRRWQAVGDVRVEIDTALADPDGLLVDVSSAPREAKFWKRVAPVVAATAIVFSLIAGFAGWRLRPSLSPPVVARFAFTLPEGQQFTNPGRQLASISPDGSQIVYVANLRLFRKPMRELDSISIPGAETTGGILNPVFSPDGQSLAFWSAGDSTIKRIAISGGAAVTVCQASAPFGMHWETDDTILFGQGAAGIMRVPASGGTPSRIVMVDASEIAFGPQLLPGGKALLFTLAKPGQNIWNTAKIVVQSLNDGKRTTIIEGGHDARYLPGGYLTYVLNGNLLAVRFDADRLQKTGGPTALVEGVRTGVGTAHYSISNTGSLIYVSGQTGASVQYQLARVDRNGSAKPLGLPLGQYHIPRVSPNGKQLAVSMNDEDIVFVYDLSGASSMRRLTFGGRNTDPMWSTDSERIFFKSDRDKDQAVFGQRADGAGAAERLTTGAPGMQQFPVSWHPHQQLLTLTQNSNTGDWGIWLFSTQDKKNSVLIDLPGSVQTHGQFSPDGRWIAYMSNESSRFEIFVQPFPLTGAKYQITRDGGEDPIWSPDGKELFFVKNRRLFSVAIHTEPSVSFGNPTGTAINGFIQGLGNGPRQYDIMPDGKGFVMLFPPDQTNAPASATQIQVVLNWLSELEQRIPVK